MASWQWFGRLHRKVYEKTGGRIGGRLAGLPMLLLTTTGRKSGLPRTTPLVYMPDGDDYVIVGSNNGRPRDPVWWSNLEASPQAEIQIMTERHRAIAREANESERARLWPALKKFNPAYARYESRTTRKIPVVILSREP